MTEGKEYQLVSVEEVKDEIRAAYNFKYLQHTFDMILELMEKHGDTHTWMDDVNVSFSGTAAMVDKLRDIIKYRHPEEFKNMETCVRIRCEEEEKCKQEKQEND